jgi:hypothetical protein
LICVLGICLSVAPSRAMASAEEDAQLWEGRFSQCSYNAVSSVLRHFYGAEGGISDRKAFEQKVFAGPLDAAGFGPYYGWGPWTGYMVESGRMIWNGKRVTGLKAERFSLRPAQDIIAEQRHFVIQYAPHERATLRETLLAELRKGPVVMWTPYAGVLDASKPGARPWHHVKRQDALTDVVPFGPFTHSVTLFLRGQDKVLVTDCSVWNGVYTTDADTIVSTAAAMTGFVRLKNRGEKSMIEKGFAGISDDAYNVVFFPADADAR